MREILVIRHGETDWNAQGRLQGTLDTPLNQRGHRQAEAAAQALRTLGVQTIFASPMLRARKTAEIISGALGVPVVFREALREKHFGTLQGLSPEELEARYGSALWAMRTALDLAPPGGETNRQVIQRLQPVIEEIKALDQRVLLVTHGALSRVIYRMLTHADDEAFGRFRMDNCEILTFRPADEGRYTCESLGVTTEEIV